MTEEKKEFKENFEFTTGTEVATYGDLKRLLESFTEEELMQKIRFWGDEYGSRVVSVEKTNCDFINPSGEGLEPADYYKQFSPDDVDYIDISEEPVSMKKGTYVLAGSDLKEDVLKSVPGYIARLNVYALARKMYTGVGKLSYAKFNEMMKEFGG